MSAAAVVGAVRLSAAVGGSSATRGPGDALRCGSVECELAGFSIPDPARAATAAAAAAKAAAVSIEGTGPADLTAPLDSDACLTRGLAGEMDGAWWPESELVWLACDRGPGGGPGGGGGGELGVLTRLSGTT